MSQECLPDSSAAGNRYHQCFALNVSKEFPQVMCRQDCQQ